MADTGASLRAYYAARAREYERIYEKPERQGDLRQLETLLSGLFTGRHVLEVACGTGYWTRFLARQAQTVTAIDAVPEVLEIAAVKDWPAGRVRFRIADAYALPDEFGGFDAAFAGFWWSHIPVRDRRRFLDALNRRLLPGATVVFLDNLFVAGNSTPIDHRDANGNTYQRRRLDDGSEHIVLKNFPTEAELSADVAGYGRSPRFTRLEYYWLFSFEKQRHGAVS